MEIMLSEKLNRRRHRRLRGRHFLYHGTVQQRKPHYLRLQHRTTRYPPWSEKANGKETKSCLGPVFNFKLGCFVMCTIAWPIQARHSLELKTQLRYCPVHLSLSMYPHIFSFSRPPPLPVAGSEPSILRLWVECSTTLYTSGATYFYQKMRIDCYVCYVLATSTRGPRLLLFLCGH
jgi:hypothetical protein